MERYPAQPSYELVLDARRLIITCGLVIFVCGIFFILGFVEGKRQVIQASLAERSASVAPSGSGIPKNEPAMTQPAAPLKPAEDQQNWYDKVGTQAQPARQQPPTDVVEKAVTSPAPPATKPATTQPVTPAKPAGTAFYSCQVGAFRQQKEAQTKANELKARGYDSVIEAPVSTNGLFLLKVGRFSTRAEAVAMQTRLKKAGYSSFIKTGH